MASIGERIKEFRKSRHLTQRDLSKLVNLTPQVISNYERGYSTPSAHDLEDIAHALNVSVSDLYAEKNSKLTTHDAPYYELTDKDHRDIAKEIDHVLAGLESKGEVNFYGEPMSDEDRELFKTTMTTAYEIAKREAKRRFTPKKYRHDSDSVEK